MNYVSSHDDSWPFDKKREKPMESATKLLLAPGIAQVYYGDESARPLEIEGAEGDANLRSNMNWEAIASDPKTIEVLTHWQKLGNFRKNHPAVGAGVHQQISAAPYVFSRTFTLGKYTDKVVVGLDLPSGKKELSVGAIFPNGTKVKDAYSGKTTVISKGKATIESDFDIVLLEKI
jgi:alpha-amylase